MPTVARTSISRPSSGATPSYLKPIGFKQRKTVMKDQAEDPPRPSELPRTINLARNSKLTSTSNLPRPSDRSPVSNSKTEQTKQASDNKKVFKTKPAFENSDLKTAYPDIDTTPKVERL